MNYIYGLREPDTGLIRYIGKTIDPHRRWLNHLCEKSHCRRTYWIRKLERRGLRPELIIIEEVSGGWPWQESERFWIKFALQNGWPLVNMTSGGDGASEPSVPIRRYYGKDHWTHKKPECVASGDRNGSRRHPELILRGSRCPASRLNEVEVKKIRLMAYSRVPYTYIAKIFKTSYQNIYHIVNRRSWNHV